MSPPDVARAALVSRPAVAGERTRVGPMLAALGVVLLAAALLRLPWLGTVPPGFQFDEAYNAIDAWRVLGGARDLFFPANGGREPLLSYWQAAFFGLFGPSLAALRLASVVIGLVTLAVVPAASARILWRREDALTLGVLAAAVMAVTYWHVHFSRYSIRAIFVPLFMTLVFWAYTVGTGPGAPRTLPLFLAGAALAGSVYAHPTGRLLPLALLLYTLWLIWADRRNRWGYALSLSLVGAVSFALFLPLGFFFLDHRWLFFGHPSDVSILDPSVHGGNLWTGLLNQVVAVLGMVTFRGDRSDFHNLPFRPTFDPVMSVAFAVGLITVGRAAVTAWRGIRGADAATRLSYAPYVLLALWAGVAVAPTLLSDAAPNFSRAIGVLPVLALVAAQGLMTMARWAAQRGWPQVARALPVVVLVVAGAWTVRDYFGVWATQPKLYYSYDQDKEDVARHVLALSERGRVFMSPLWATHATVTFLTRDNPPEAVTMARGAVIPMADGRDATYVFPAEQARQARRFEGWMGEAAERIDVADRQGKPHLIVFKAPSAARPQGTGAGLAWGALRPVETRSAAFVEGPHLVGLTGDARLAPGDTARYDLYWRAPTPIGTPLTLFAHLVDAEGRTVVQDDHAPLDTSYPTTAWRASEVILDQVQFRLPETLPHGEYRVRVGWYDGATGERRVLSDGTTALEVGRLVVAAEGK